MNVDLPQLIFDEKEKKNNLQFQVGYPGIYGGYESHLDMVPYSKAVGSAGPVLFEFLGRLYISYTDQDFRVLIREIDDIGKIWEGWSTCSFLQDQRTERKIAAAVFNGTVFVTFLERGPSGRLLCLTSQDLKHWEMTSITPSSSQDGAALAVSSGPGGPRLYCAYAERGGDGPLNIVSTKDGTAWTPPTQILAAQSGRPPALVAFRDQEGEKLYCFYRGAGNDSQIHYALATWPP